MEDRGASFLVGYHPFGEINNSDEYMIPNVVVIDPKSTHTS